MKTSIKKVWTLPLFLAVAVSSLQGVEPQPKGVRLTWNASTFEINYGVWENVSPSTNWVLLGTTIAANWTITNAVTTDYNWGITAIRMSNGVILPQIDVGVAHWPPSITAGPKTVKVTPVGGYVIDAGRWVKVSSDLATFDDWISVSVVNGKIHVEHLTSPLKPHMFFSYPTAAVAPTPSPTLRPR